MAELIFRKEGVIYRDEISTPFGPEIVEKKVSYNEIKGLKLSSVSVDPVIEDGVLKAIRMEVEEFKVIGTKKESKEGGYNLADLIEKRLAEGDWPPYVVAYSRALLNPNTMASALRNIIKERKKISDKELRKIIEERGYNPDGGSYSAILYVLDKVTGEIKRMGRGKDKMYEWVGRNGD